MNEQTFDGITFHSDNELINFLRQSYYAHKSTIRALEADRDKYRSFQQNVQADVCRATGGKHVWVTAVDYGEVCGPCGTRR